LREEDRGEKEEAFSYGNSYWEDSGEEGNHLKEVSMKLQSIIQYLHQQQWRDHIIFMLKKDELISSDSIQLIERMQSKLDGKIEQVMTL